MVTRPGSGLLPRRPGRGCPVVESRVAQNAKSLRVTSRSVKTGVAHYVQVMTVSISLFPVSVRFPAWARQLIVLPPETDSALTMLISAISSILKASLHQQISLAPSDLSSICDEEHRAGSAVSAEPQHNGLCL